MCDYEIENKQELEKFIKENNVNLDKLPLPKLNFIKDAKNKEEILKLGLRLTLLCEEKERIYLKAFVAKIKQR